MLKNLAKLSVFALLINFIGGAKADSLFVSVRGEGCSNISAEHTRAEIRYDAYDKAAVAAVKSAPYFQTSSEVSDEYRLNMLAYQLADKILSDVAVITVRENEREICLEVSGKLDKEKTEEMLAGKDIRKAPTDIGAIAQKVNTVLPKSMYETDKALPLIYIKKMEYYNGTVTDDFTPVITDKLAFEPRILITENEELADYFIFPKLLLSKIEPLNQEEQKYSMSVAVEIYRQDGTLITSTRQNRYIIISNKENVGQTARKLLIKLLEDGVDELSDKLKALLKP